MSALVLVGVAVAAALGAGMGTAVVRRQALARGVQDIPNERSSHVVPTPRGGGLAVVVVVLVTWLGLAGAGHLGWPWALALVCGGTSIAVIGGLDDLGGLSARTRLLAHGAAAAAVVAALGLDATLQVTDTLRLPAGVTHVFAWLYVVWSINLFNFMDGIDGIAGAQVVTVGAVAALAAWVSGAPWVAVAFVALVGAALGFLRHNWHPASIFMGDVGSGFLGFALGATSLWAEREGALSVEAFSVVMGTFVVDATYTLLRRVAAGERPFQAHRDHAYQHAVQRGWRHSTVAAAYAAVTLGWLAPLAWVAWSRPTWAPLLVVVAFVPLVAGCVRLRAGVRGA